MAIQILPPKRGLAESLGDLLGSGAGFGFQEWQRQRKQNELKRLEEEERNRIGEARAAAGFGQYSQLPSNEFIALAKEQGSQNKQENAFERKQNIPFVQQTEKAYELGNQIETIASRMKELLSTGKVAEGFKGRLPVGFLNEESQEFDALSKELALLRSQGSGTATNLKISTLLGSKPNLSQSSRTQQKLIDNVIEDAIKLKSPYEIIQELQQNNANPIDLRKAVFQQMRTPREFISQQQMQAPKTLSQQGWIQELPDAASSMNDEYENENGERVRSNGREWVPVGGKNAL